MKIPKSVEAIIITVLYLTCLFYWTLPIQDNKFPYGEVDASSHYTVADYTWHSDRSIIELPHYIDMRYGKDNEFKEHVLWYPPPFHYLLAIASVFGGDTNAPVHIANAIYCSLIVLSVYFILRQLFGFKAALASAFLLIFSMRDIMVYLWGQWPERAAFAFLPIILFTFYKYAISCIDKEPKPIYAYLTGILLAINLFVHPMDFFHTAMAILVISALLLIKHKKLFFRIKDMAIVIPLFVLIVAIFPYQTMNVVVTLTEDAPPSPEQGDISRLFSWFKPPQQNPGVPPQYFNYKDMIGPLWTIPFLLIGISFLLLRRSNKDLVMLGWLISLYIMIHLDVIGKGRTHRSLSGTAHIFYPLIILGVIYLITYIPKIKGVHKPLKNAILIGFVILMVASTGAVAKSTLQGSYQGFLRINPYQYEFTQWLRDSSVPKDAEMYHMGALSLSKTRWLWMVGHRHMRSSERENLADYNVTHIIFDYSDFAAIGNQNAIAQMQGLEQQTFANRTPMFNNNFIRVYPFEN